MASYKRRAKLTRLVIVVLAVGSLVYGLGIYFFSWPPFQSLNGVYVGCSKDSKKDISASYIYTDPIEPSSVQELKPGEAIVYLTWAHDPTSTITVQWISLHNRAGILFYRPLGQEPWELKRAESVHYLPGSHNLFVHWNTIKGLEPGTTYEFFVLEEQNVRSFSTMPQEANDTIRIAFAGDSRRFTFWFEELTQTIGEFNPHLLVGKGDYVACEGIVSTENTDKWLYFLRALEANLVNENGHMIPFILAMGNHEVDTGFQYNQPNEPEEAEYMWHLFASPRLLEPEDNFYGALEVSNYLQILFLDSIHTAPIGGDQTEWLRATIDDTKTHIIPVYHSAVFPSSKPFNSQWKVEIRELWLPLFHENNVRVVMEACDHTYKRTVPIAFSRELPAGTENYIRLETGYLFEKESGMIFFGDGGWGVPIRDIYNPETTWYLARAIGANIKRGIATQEGVFIRRHPNDGRESTEIENAYHFLLVEIKDESTIVKSINYKGYIFDETVIR